MPVSEKKHRLALFQVQKNQSTFPGGLPKKASFGPYKYSVPSQRLPPKKSRQTNQANTLPETKIAPENRPSQKKTSIPTIHF